MRPKEIVLYILCFFYAIIGGYGNWDGTDWTQFYGVFRDARWDNIFSYTRYGGVKMEPGYMFLNILSKSLFGTYANFLFLTTFFYLCIASKTILKQSSYPILTFTIFFFTRMQFLILRQFIAASLLIWAFNYIEKRNIRKFSILVICACLIHKSAIVFFPMYWIPLLPLNYITCNSIYLFSIFLASYLREYIALFALIAGGDIEERVSIYVVRGSKDVMLMPSTIIFCMLLINATLYIRSKMSDIKKIFSVNVFLSGYLVGISLTMIFHEGFEELQRLSAFYFICTPIVWAYIFNYCFKKTLIVRAALILFFLIYVYKKFWDLEMFSSLYNTSAYIPYRMSFK